MSGTAHFKVVVFLLALFGLYLPAYAQRSSPAEQLTEEEIRNMTAYGKLAEGEGLEGMREQAQQEFGGRGPALARHFLYHQSPPNNSVFFFLFGTVGEVETADILIHALPDPPKPVDSVVPRHPGEIEVAIEKILQNDSVRTDPAVLEALKETLTKARQHSADPFPVELLISLMGRLKTSEAAQLLQGLTQNSDPAIRAAAVDALGQTEQSSIHPILVEAMREDSHPAVRSEAAEALAQFPLEKSISFLLATLEKETNLQVIDAILTSLIALHALPEEPKECLKLAKMGWDVKAVMPYFYCWQKTAPHEALIEQAISGTWAVRALALNALTQYSHLQGPLTLAKPASMASHSLEEPIKAKLLHSAIEILSHDMRGSHRQSSVSYSMVYMAKEAVWEITGHHMAAALAFADRIQPLHGRYDYIGRFGASSYLASKDAEAYSALRRPRQLLSAALLALASGLLLFPLPTRKFGAGLLGGICLWVIFMMLESGVQEFPPPPLWVLSVPFLAFLTAGLVTGAMAFKMRRSRTLVFTSPVTAGIAALVICSYTRSQGWYPIGDGGWALFFDPMGCALLAAPASFIISLGLMPWRTSITSR